ncbi:MAG: DNA polymerase I [Oscillospiraceae bacterium]|nr:DNA polymerase I [Oscillospiraceae bacterium]
MKLLCIDGNSILNRAFYAIKLLTTKDGRYTNAVQGFLSIFLKLREQYAPDAVAVAFDERGKTFRHEQYAQYKATRKGMPPELAEQLDVVKALLTDLGYTWVSCRGYEADDILGAFAARCAKDGDPCLIATGDRDSLQLISDTATVLLTTTKFGRGETTEMTPEAMMQTYGIAPKQLIDVKALMGDSSDNIPGVAGVGEKTAFDLIQKFGSLDGVYQNLDSDAIKPGVREKLLQDRDAAYMSRTLATIVTDVPVETDPAAYVKKEGDPAAAAALLAGLEMHTMLARLGLDAAPALARKAAAAAVPETAAEPLTDGALAGLKTLYVYADERGFFAAAGGRAFRLDKASLEAALRADAEKRCYDAKALWHFALERGFEIRNLTFDLKLAAYLLNPSASTYALDVLEKEYAAAPRFVSEVPSLGALEDLCEKLARMLEQQDMRALHDDIELPLARVLAEMEQAGFAVDRAGIEAFGGELSALVEKKQEEVFELAGRRFNLNSPKQLGEVLFGTLGLPAGKMNKSGYSTNAETLEKLRGDYPVVDRILEYRTYQKLNSTYVAGLLAAVDANGRIHTEFKQTETRTGRISSREPNLQNIPVRTELGGRFRRYFVAAPGNVLCDADYSQIELRVLASISDDKRMNEAFASGRDIHTETACEIFKLPRSMITPELRRRAKAVNFGIVYGIGAFSLSKDTGVSLREASSYIENYLAPYSGVAADLKRTGEQAQKDGFVTTLYKRRRMLPELASSNKNLQALGRRLAMNTPIQGTAADIIKLAMIRVSERLRGEKLDARLVLQVHDELIVESAEKDAARASAVLKEEMEKAAKLATPLAVDVGTGKTWYEAKL